jgi:hypothetical protein
MSIVILLIVYYLALTKYCCRKRPPRHLKPTRSSTGRDGALTASGQSTLAWNAVSSQTCFQKLLREAGRLRAPQSVSKTNLFPGMFQWLASHVWQLPQTTAALVVFSLTVTAIKSNAQSMHWIAGICKLVVQQSARRQVKGDADFSK